MQTKKAGAIFMGALLVSLLAGGWHALAQDTAKKVPAAPAKTMASKPQPATPSTPAEPRHWYSVNVVTIKPELVNDWIEFQKSQTVPALQKGGQKARDAWQSGVFGEAFTYAFVAPIDKFAQFDAPNPIANALGADGAKAYIEKNRHFVSSSRTFAIQTRPELSYMPNATMTPKFAILTETSVLSGHADEYEAYLKTDYVPVLKKASVPGFSVSRTVFGGDTNEYATLLYVDSFSEVDKGPAAVRVLGEAAAQKLFAKSQPHIASQKRSILRYVPDLSFRVRMSTDAR